MAPDKWGLTAGVPRGANASIIQNARYKNLRSGIDISARRGDRGGGGGGTSLSLEFMNRRFMGRVSRAIGNFAALGRRGRNKTNGVARKIAMHLFLLDNECKKAGL